MIWTKQIASGVCQTVESFWNARATAILTVPSKEKRVPAPVYSAPAVEEIVT